MISVSPLEYVFNIEKLLPPRHTLRKASRANLSHALTLVNTSLPVVLEYIFRNGKIINASELKASKNGSEKNNQPKILIELNGVLYVVTKKNENQIFIERSKLNDPNKVDGGVTLYRDFHGEFRDLEPLLDQKIAEAIQEVS